ncbi:hypothetical protein BDW22DRAFT_1431004 [Trametopsis cervina]|nr:hypothetical protein BDW22DRAFT_1431004 [Trametopsis cervina]
MSSKSPEWTGPITLRGIGLTDVSSMLNIKVISRQWFRNSTLGIGRIDVAQLATSKVHRVDLHVHGRTRRPMAPVPSVSFSIAMHSPIQTADGPSTTLPADLTTNHSLDKAEAVDSAASPNGRIPEVSTPIDYHSTLEPGNISLEGSMDPKEEANKQPSAPVEIIKNIIDGVNLKAEDLNSPVPLLQAVSTAGAAADNAADEAGSVLSTWVPIIDNINAFMSVASQIADIHPYAKAAWNVISAIPKIINTQLENDKSMAELVKAIDDTFVFVCETERLELHNVASHAMTVKRLVQQTTESGMLLSDYLRTRKFWARTLKHSLSDVQSMFRQHAAVFERLRQEFINDAVLESEANTRNIQAMTSRIDIAAVRTWELVDSTAAVLEKHVAKDYLDDMHYIYEAQCVSEKRCLPGTRESIISDITDWAYDYANGPEARAGIFLLTGVAGCGKSAIAHEIAHRFADMHRLGSSFCFDASRQAARSPNYLFSTISRGIAKLDARWKDALVAVLQEPYAEPKTMSQEKQIEDFLNKPSHKLHFVGPIVVVIDALDESGSRDSREGLIKNIVKMSKILPSNFRFLITTRAEEDIMATLPDEPNVTCVDLVSIDAASTSSDIRHLIEIELSSNPRTLGLLEKAYPDRTWLTRLVDSSQNGVVQLSSQYYHW